MRSSGNSVLASSQQKRLQSTKAVSRCTSTLRTLSRWYSGVTAFAPRTLAAVAFSSSGQMSGGGRGRQSERTLAAAMAFSSTRRMDRWTDAQEGRQTDGHSIYPGRSVALDLPDGKSHRRTRRSTRCTDGRTPAQPTLRVLRMSTLRDKSCPPPPAHPICRRECSWPR
jgi:hypothetical protein